MICVQIADFGLSRVLENNATHISTNTHGEACISPPHTPGAFLRQSGLPADGRSVSKGAGDDAAVGSLCVFAVQGVAVRCMPCSYSMRL